MKKPGLLYRILIMAGAFIFATVSLRGQTTTTFTCTLGAARNWNGVVWTKTPAGSNATYPGQTGYAGENAGDIHHVVINATGAFTLSLNVGSITSHVGNITINNTGGTATLAIGGNSLTMTGILSGGGTLTIGAGILNIAGNNTSTGTFTQGTGTVNYNGSAAQQIRGTTYNNLTISGNSVKTLAAATTINATLTVNAGATLALSTFNLGSPTSVVLECGSVAGSSITGTGTLTLGGNVTVNNVPGTNGASISAPVTLGATRTFTVADDGSNATDLTISGIITGAAFGITKAGAGTMALSAANTYTGAVTISAGMLSANTLANAGAGNTSSLGTGAGTSAITISGAGTLQYTGTGHSSSRPITLTGSGASIDASGSGAITLSGNISGNTFNLVLSGTGAGLVTGIISTTSGTITKTSTGTWTLSGANTFTGLTSISSGTLKLGVGSNVAGNGPLGTNAGGVTVSSGAVFDLNGFTIGATNGEALTINGTGLIALPAGALTNTGVAASYLGPITLGSASIITATASGTLTVAAVTNGTNALTLDGSGAGTVSGIIGASSGALTKNGNGSWTLSGTNTFTGGTTLNAGTININNANALGTVAGLFTINGGAINNTSAGPVTTLDYPQTWAGNFTFTGGAQNLNLGNGPITMSSSLQLTVTANTLTAGGIITAGTNNLTKAGTGTLSMGANTITLNGLIISAGIFTAPSATMNLAGDFSNSGTFNNNGGTLNFNGSGVQSVAGVTYNNLILSGSGAKTFGASTTINGNLTISGTASASLSDGTTSVANTLTLGAAAQPSGSYGGIGSAATYKNSTYFAGGVTGILNVSTSSCTAGSWTGGTSTDWNTATNWCDGTVPAASTNVVINPGVNQPVIGATAFCNNISINAGASLTISGSNSLTVSGNMVNSGTVIPNTGTVVFNGTAQTIGAADYYNLTLSGSGVKTTTGVTVNSVFSIEGTATASVAPTYGAAATLQYNTASARNAGVEWITPFAATGGVIIANAGVITLDASKVFNTSVPLTINSGASLNTSAANNYSLTFGGNFVNNGGTITANASPVTITSTMATQSIAGFATTGLVSMAKTGGTATFTGNVTGGGLTINGAGGTLDLGPGLTHAFTGTWTRTTGSLNGGSSTLNLTGNFSGTGGTFTANAGIVNYNAAGAQTVAGVTYNNLTISGSGIKTLGGDAAVSGTITLSSGTFAVSGNTLTLNGPPIAGSPTNLSTAISSNLVFGGSSTGIVIPSSVSNLNNLTVDNINGVSLNSSISLSNAGILTITSGNLILGDYNFTVTAPLAGSPFSSTNMIVTNGSGAFIKTGAAVAAFQITYPVGTTGYYSPMVINTLAATTGSGTISVRAVANKQANVPFTNDALQKFWVVSTTGIAGITDARLTFAYNSGEVVGNAALYVPRVWNGSTLATPAGATAAGVNPFGVNAAGNTIINGEWTALDQTTRTPFYSYQSGNWNDFNTWTLDPSGTLFTNPSNLVPSSSDKVNINTGHIVAMTTNAVTVSSLNIEGTLDLAATTGHTFATLSGYGRIRISDADVFPVTTTNTFFTTDQGTVEYYGNSFTLSTARNIYNLEVNMSAGQILTLTGTPYNLAGNLTVKQGTIRINDDASTVQKILTVLKDITIKSGASFTVGQGNTLNGTVDETATGAMQFFLAHNSINCYGNLINNGTIRFTNQAAPVYNAFTSTGAVTLFMKGATDNTLACNGITDLYNLVIDKGTNQNNKITLYSSTTSNFRLYGPDGLYDYATGGGFTQENPELRKPLWIRNGTLELTGYIFIPSLTEGGGDYYIPANGALWLNGANVTVWNTDRTNPGASVGGVQGTGVNTTTGGSQSFSVFGNLQTTKGLFSTGSHGIVLWYQPTVFGRILVEGGQCDINGIRTANGNTAGKFSFIQTGGLIRFLGDNGNETMENYASLCLRGTDCSFTMSGGTMEFYDGQAGNNDAVTSTGGIIRIESNPANIDVTGGTVKIIRNVAGGNNYSIYTSAPFFNLELTGASGTPLTANINSVISVLNNLTINDYSTLDVTASNNNISIGGNFTLGNTVGTNNAVYNARSNTTTFNGNQSSTITVTNTANAIPLTFYNLTINKTPTSSLATAWPVTLSSPGRTETAGAANNHLLTISNDLLINEGRWNNYRFKTRVQNHITNYGTIFSDATNPGRITLENGSVQHQLTGSTSVVNSFGDFELNDANGAQVYSNISTGNFYLTTGILDINTYNLAVTTGISGNTYDITKMIRSYGSPSSQGVTISLSVSGNYTNQDISLIPVGVGGTFTGNGTIAAIKYTPLTINLNGNAGAGPFTGTVNIRPVDEYHPTSDPNNLGDLIPFYWKTDITGNLSSVPGTVVNYSLYSSYAFNYGGGKKECYYRTTTWTEGDNAANPLVFAGTGFITTDYTAGKKNSFRTPKILYSRQSGDWSTLGTWSTVGHSTTSAPTVLNSFDVYEIGGSGGVNHQVTVTASNTLASKVIIQSKAVTGIATDPPPSLIVNSSLTGNDFNLITGGGRFVLNDGTLPNGDYLDFCYNDTSIFEFSGGTYTLPSTLTVYPNLWISGTASSNKTLPNANILIRKNLNINDRTNTGITLTLSNTANGNVTVNDSLVLDNQSKLIYQNSGTARTVTVLKNINCVIGGASEVNSIEVASGGASNLSHQLVVQGVMRLGATTMNLYSANSVVDLVLNGETNSRIYNYSGALMSLNKLIVNKSSSTLKATIDKPFSIGAATNSVVKPLLLQQGVLRINNASTNLVLSSGGGDYTIPAMTSLILDQGSLSVSGNSTGLTLNGLLEINGGSVSVYNGANTNNYIQYSSTGEARININGGTLRIGSQIRRFTTTSGGVLTYNQTGGTVEVGYNDAPTANRGVFEVVNTGSSFTLTGGTLTILRGQTSATVPSFFIEPTTSNIGSGMTITLGGGSGSPQIGIYSSVPLPNITLNGTGTPTVLMLNGPLSVENNLTINSGATFNANGIQLNIKGNFNNSGTFIPGSNTTVFDGASVQSITGSSTFYDLTKPTSNTLNINSNIQISNNLRVEGGILADNGNTIRVLRNVYNTGTITYGGVANSSTQLGLHMNGSVSQSIEGTGTFGKITVDNTDGVYLPLGTSINISNSLRLNQGLLDIQGNLLELGINCAIEGSGFNSYKMIQTNISFTDNGIKKYFPSGAQTFTYPIGSNGKYTPVTFNITANASSTGSITLKAANELHPSVTDDTESGCQLNDLNNVLQYYWVLVSNGISGFTGTASMTGLVSDIKVNNSCGFTSADYITAKLLTGSATWNKFTSDKFNESTCQLDFDFISTNDNGISGDYLAGIDAAIPNSVTVYQTINSGNWTNGAIWETVPAGGPIPAGGPRGSVVIINPAHTVDVISNGTVFSYNTTINGTLNFNSTTQHRLGYVFGTGILRMVNNSSLPAGDYFGTNGFITSTGGTLEYAGNTNYSVLSNISSLNNVTFSGSGTRDLPNNNLLVYGSVTISGATLNNAFDMDMEIRKDFTMTSGRFFSRVNSGNPKIILGGTNAQSISGNFTAANSSDFYNLEVNKSLNSVTQGSAIEVLNNLFLVSGIINTTSVNMLTITNPVSSAVTGGSASSFINGPLRKKIDNGDDFLFQVGKGSRYGSISALSAESAGANFFWTAEYFNTGHSDLTTSPATFNKSTTEYWRLNSPVNGYTSKVKLRWDTQSDISPATTSISDIRVAEYNGVDWVEKVSDTPIGDNNNGTVQTTLAIPVNNASDPQYYTLGSVSTVRPTITLGTSPQVCAGSTTANLPYTATTGSPNQYTIDYDAAANTAGFIDVTTWTALPATPVLLVVPGTAAVGTYNATIRVRASGTPLNVSAATPFTVALSPLPNAITGTTTVCVGSTTTLANTTPGGTWSSATSAVATITSGGVVTGVSAGTSVISYTVAGCGSTVTITVNPMPSASISYTGSPWCINAGVQIVTLTGTTGGTYSAAPAGLTLNSASGAITPGTSTAGTYIVTYTIAAAGGCNIFTTTTGIAITSDLVWTGALSTDWNFAGNWSCGFIPGPATLIQIPNVTNKPVISTGSIATVNNLTIDAGSSLTISGNTIQISGTIINNGTFTATNGTVEMNGSAAQVVGAGTFAGNTIKDLIINNNAGVTLQGALNVSGIVTVSSGILSSGGNLTLLSTASGTALINGSGVGTVTGNVTMQRYLPSGFGYKYFSSPFQAATVSEFGDDMDLTAPFTTFYKYDENRFFNGVPATGWVKYNTPANILYPLSGYAVNFGSAVTAKTADVSGIVNNGPLSVNLYNHNQVYTTGFNLVGNPYPSPIDWNLVSPNNINVDNAIYLFNATDEYDGTYSSLVNGVPSNGATSIIPSMQGFFVHITPLFPVEATLVMNNSVRITDQTSPFAKSANKGAVPLLRLSASYSENPASFDPVVVYFDDKATTNFDTQLDALKMFNTSFEFPNLYAVSSDGFDLSISSLPPNYEKSFTVPLSLSTYKDGEVIFKVSDLSLSLPGIRIYFSDTAAGIEMEITEGKEYIISLPAADYMNRFYINFSNITTNSAEINTGSTEPIIIYCSMGVLNAEINELQGSEGLIMITNITGQTLYTNKVYEKGHHEFTPSLKDGIYIVNYLSGKIMVSQKIIFMN